jgi:hypothetical protein
MKKLLLLLLLSSLHSQEVKSISPASIFEVMGDVLKGTWSLSPVEAQIDTTGAHKNKAVASLLGTKAIGTKYAIIGGGATLQETLLPNTSKSMVTMYHCNDFIDCTELKATHYCAKGNQPAFILNTKESNENTFIFDCDMTTKLCQSDEDHIHKMIFEISDKKKHLKASYLSWENKKLKNKHSIYHFDRL